ncbi:hypothetical protein PMAYCL1PPCAC_10925, partial [Pristionchus mayeri]
LSGLETLSILFQSWTIDRVITSFYSIEDDQRSVEWIFSTSRVTGYCQLKYLIPDILPDYVDKVIYFDTDMLILEDIAILNSYITEMISKGRMYFSIPS